MDEQKKSELYTEAVTGSYDELCISGGWYINMIVFGLSYESAGELTVGDLEELIPEHRSEYDALWKNLFAEWKRNHAIA